MASAGAARCAQASQHEALKMLLNKASIIDELEATFPRRAHMRAS